MPVSPDYAARLAARVRDVYGDAELVMLVKVARRLARGITEPGWAEDKLAQVGELRKDIAAELAALAGKGGSAVAEAVSEAYRRGQDAADTDLRQADQDAATARAGAGSRAVRVLADEGAQLLAATALPVRRSVVDIYRKVTADTTAQVLAGTQSRREAAASALARYARAGVSGFTDKAGRSWDLPSYAEMATRTTAGQAAVTGHTDRLQRAGQHLVIVSDAPEECPLCRPFEGEVLTLDGYRPPGVRVTASLDEATRAGLFHPNCRHSLSMYLPGITTKPSRTADPDGDELRQRQRAYERSIRAHKRQVAALEALLGNDDPRVKRQRRKLRQRQADFKAWRDVHGRKNLSYRTSLTTR